MVDEDSAQPRHEELVHRELLVTSWNMGKCKLADASTRSSNQRRRDLRSHRGHHAAHDRPSSSWAIPWTRDSAHHVAGAERQSDRRTHMCGRLRDVPLRSNNLLGIELKNRMGKEVIALSSYTPPQADRESLHAALKEARLKRL